MRESFLVGLVSCCVAVAIVLSVLYTQFDDKSSIDAKLAQLGHSAVLWRGENHEVIGFDNSTESFSYVVFTDPQYGLRDMTDDNGDGTEWQHDRSNMRLLCEKINALEPKPQFIFVTGDLSNARPESNEEITPGFMSSYRSPQQIDLLTDLGLFDEDIPILVNTGNHDINESPDKVTVGAHERVWGDAYFSFWVKGQIFLALESQFFRSEDPVTKEFAKEEIQWLTELLSEMPKETPKTIMIHVPLFIRTPDETDSEIGTFVRQNIYITIPSFRWQNHSNCIQKFALGIVLCKWRATDLLGTYAHDDETRTYSMWKSRIAADCLNVNQCTTGLAIQYSLLP